MTKAVASYGECYPYLFIQFEGDEMFNPEEGVLVEVPDDLVTRFNEAWAAFAIVENEMVAHLDSLNVRRPL